MLLFFSVEITFTDAKPESEGLKLTSVLDVQNKYPVGIPLWVWCLRASIECLLFGSPSVDLLTAVSECHRLKTTVLDQHPISLGSVQNRLVRCSCPRAFTACFLLEKKEKGFQFVCDWADLFSLSVIKTQIRHWFCKSLYDVQQYINLWERPMLGTNIT